MEEDGWKSTVRRNSKLTALHCVYWREMKQRRIHSLTDVYTDTTCFHDFSRNQTQEKLNLLYDIWRSSSELYGHI